MVIIRARSRWVEAAGDSAERRCVVSRAAALIPELWILVFFYVENSRARHVSGDDATGRNGLVGSFRRVGLAPRLPDTIGHKGGSRPIILYRPTGGELEGLETLQYYWLMLLTLPGAKLTPRNHVEGPNDTAPATARKGRYKSAFFAT